jgi:hypothetical protein
VDLQEGRTAMRAGVAVLAAMAVAVGTGKAEAQGRPLSVTGQNQLTFATVFPGVPEMVSYTDAVNAGAFQVRGIKDAEVALTFTLPSKLQAPGARTLNLLFGPSDGAWNRLNSVATARTFDPRVVLTVQLSQQGRLFLWLGGTALPTATQAAGSYTGTVTLTAAYTGN